jgi:autotransporter adhesin
VGTTTYGGFAGIAPVGVVSVGSAGNERQITNVAAGRITATSTDAINGSQLNSVASSLGASISNVAADLTNNINNVANTLNNNINNVANTLDTKINNVSTTLGASITNVSNTLDNKINNVSTTLDTKITTLANTPLTFTGNTGSTAQKLGGTLQITGKATTAGTYSGDNIRTVVVGNEVQIQMADAPSFTNMKAAGLNVSNYLTVAPATVVNIGGNVITNVAAGAVTPTSTDAVNGAQLQKVQAGSVQYATNPNGTPNYGSVILGNGQAGGTTVSNLAPGVAGTDAVNLNQLNGVSKAVNELALRVDANARDADAGTAGAMAMAGMPQAFIPGKSMLAGAAATYQGQTSLAIGVSKLSENGNWVVKFNGSANSRGKLGVAVGAGFHW